MNIRINREVMIPALAKVGGVVERRQTLPILGNILLVASDDSVQITGTDLEVEVRSRCLAVVNSPGEVTVPARKLIDICRAVPEAIEITLRVENDRTFIAAGRSRFTLGTLPAANFPVMDSGAGEERVEIGQGELKGLLERTAFAMANQDVRYYLNGLLLEVRRDRLVAVATDGHRLAKAEVGLQSDIGEEIQIILPRKSVLELSRLLGTEDESVVVDISRKTFRAFVLDTVLTSKVVDGCYPEYERVIPRSVDRVAVVDRDALRLALLRTAVLSNEKYKGVRLSFDAGRLHLQAHNPEQEEAEDEVEIDYSQEPTTIGFNVGYLMDVLNVLTDSDVEIAFSDASSSAIVRNRGRDEETYVVMPMRL